MSYFVKIEKQSIFNPRKAGECKEYAEKEFENCVDDGFQNFTHAVLVCEPPWMTTKNACTDMSWKKVMTTYIEKAKYKLKFATWVAILHKIIEMENFQTKQNCAVPCSETRSSIRNGFSKAPIFDKGTWLVFEERVTVSQNVIGYTFSDFLIDLGSSVGLWFGISVIGLTDLGVQLVTFIKPYYHKISSYIKK